MLDNIQKMSEDMRPHDILHLALESEPYPSWQQLSIQA